MQLYKHYGSGQETGAVYSSSPHALVSKVPIFCEKGIYPSPEEEITFLQSLQEGEEVFCNS